MIAAALVLLAALSANAATPEEVFRNPPREAHVGVWWHWMGSQVTEEGIRKDLDWFKDGIGARPSKGRKCFTTWNYFTKDSKLSTSGLICPPVLTWKEK